MGLRGISGPWGLSDAGWDHRPCRYHTMSVAPVALGAPGRHYIAEQGLKDAFFGLSKGAAAQHH